MNCSGAASTDEKMRYHDLTGCDPSTIVEGMYSQKDLVNEKCRIHWRIKVGTASDADKKRYQILTGRDPSSIEKETPEEQEERKEKNNLYYCIKY